MSNAGIAAGVAQAYIDGDVGVMRYLFTEDAITNTQRAIAQRWLEEIMLADRITAKPLSARTIRVDSRQPLYDTYALIANSTRLITIPAINIGVGEDFSISLGVIMPPKDANYRWFGKDSQNRFFSSANNNLSFTTSVGLIVFTNAVQNVEPGDHPAVVFSRSGINYSCLVNGVDYAGSATNGVAISITKLYTADNTPLPAGSAMQDFIFENHTTPVYLEYPLNEAEGLTVNGRDKGGSIISGKEGTISPDADWQYIP